MRINSYSFGEITVNKKIFSSDLIIFDNKISTNWWRKKGHFIHKEDLEEVFKYNPDTLIIGTGKYGKMKVSDNIIDELNNYNIKVIVRKTDKAVNLFNKTKGKKTAALHLTC